MHEITNVSPFNEILEIRVKYLFCKMQKNDKMRFPKN